MNVADFRRIVIFGNNGSGKSYFARKLAAITGLPLIHLDREFWRPGWEMPTQAEWRQKNLEFIAGESWIIDGMCSHGGTMALRYAAADLVIYLDVNRWVCLMGVITRSKRRPDWPEHITREKSAGDFLRFCAGVLKHRNKRGIMELHEAHPEVMFYVIKGRRGMHRQIRQWREQTSHDETDSIH